MLLIHYFNAYANILFHCPAMICRITQTPLICSMTNSKPLADPLCTYSDWLWLTRFKNRTKASAEVPVSCPSSQSCRNFLTRPMPRLKPFSEVQGPRLRRVGARPPLPLKRPLDGGVYHSTHSPSSVDLYISCSWLRSLGWRLKSSVTSGEVAIDPGVDLLFLVSVTVVCSLFETPFTEGCSALFGGDDSVGSVEVCGLGAQ